MSELACVRVCVCACVSHTCMSGYIRNVCVVCGCVVGVWCVVGCMSCSMRKRGVSVCVFYRLQSLVPNHNLIIASYDIIRNDVDFFRYITICTEHMFVNTHTLWRYENSSFLECSCVQCWAVLSRGGGQLPLQNHIDIQWNPSKLDP